MSKDEAEATRLTDILPENAGKLVRAWDPDFTKVTAEEAKVIADAEKSGFVDESEIDWNSIGTDN